VSASNLLDMPAPRSGERVSSTTLPASTADRLRELITEGEIAAGTRLN